MSQRIHEKTDDLAKKAEKALHDVKETARADAGDAVQSVKKELKDSARSVRDRASEEADRGKDYAADQVDAVASAIRRSAQHYDGEVGAETVSRYAESAADRVTQFGKSLRRKDVGSIVRDAEAFARSHPALVFGMAFAGGFIAARFLRASAEENDRLEHDRQTQSHQSPRLNQPMASPDARSGGGAYHG